MNNQYPQEIYKNPFKKNFFRRSIIENCMSSRIEIVKKGNTDHIKHQILQKQMGLHDFYQSTKEDFQNTTTEIVNLGVKQTLRTNTYHTSSPVLIKKGVYLQIRLVVGNNFSSRKRTTRHIGENNIWSTDGRKTQRPI